MTCIGFLHRALMGVIILSLLVGSTLTTWAQVYRRPELPRRNDQPDKTRKPHKSTRGGVITPTTIKTSKDTELDGVDPDSRSEAVSAEDAPEDTPTKDRTTKASEWDPDEDRSLAKLRVRHKTRIILDDRKTPPIKQYIEESEESEEDEDEQSNSEDDDSEEGMGDGLVPEDDGEEDEDPGQF